MSIESSFNRDVTILRPSFANDSSGGGAETLTPIATVRGRLRWLTGREVEQLGRNSDKVRNRVYIGPEQTVEHLDILRIDGDDWEAIRPAKREGLQSLHHWEINVRRYT